MKSAHIEEHLLWQPFNLSFEIVHIGSYTFWDFRLIMTFQHKMHLITIIIAWTICPTDHKIDSPEDTCPPGPCPSCFTSRQSHNLTIFKHLNPKQDKIKYFQARSKNPSLDVVLIRLSKRNRFMNDEMLDCHGDTVQGKSKFDHFRLE